jgi:hypothetical protein
MVAFPTGGHDNGRDVRGKFTKGNRHGHGNPHNKAAQQLRGALYACVTEEDFQAVVQKLIEMAKAGSIPAIKLFLEHTIGKPPMPVHISGELETDKPAGITIADITDCILESLRDEPAARAKIAAALRDLNGRDADDLQDS